MNFDLFSESGVTAAKVTRRGRPDEYIENLDYAEVRHLKLTKREFGARLNPIKNRQQEKASVEITEESSKEDIEEINAFQAALLMRSFGRQH